MALPTKLPRNAAALVCGAALAGCAGAPADTVVPGIAAGKIQTIVVESGGEWREIRRVMTDAGNTHEKARAQYGDITFRRAE